LVVIRSYLLVICIGKCHGKAITICYRLLWESRLKEFRHIYIHNITLKFVLNS